MSPQLRRRTILVSSIAGAFILSLFLAYIPVLVAWSGREEIVPAKGVVLDLYDGDVWVKYSSLMRACLWFYGPALEFHANMCGYEFLETADRNNPRGMAFVPKGQQ
jgi:hypothetical protein